MTRRGVTPSVEHLCVSTWRGRSGDVLARQHELLRCRLLPYSATSPRLAASLTRITVWRVGAMQDLSETLPPDTLPVVRIRGTGRNSAIRRNETHNLLKTRIGESRPETADSLRRKTHMGDYARCQHTRSRVPCSLVASSLTFPPIGHCRPECPSERRSESQFYQEIARISTTSGHVCRFSCIISLLAFSYPCTGLTP